LFRFHAVTLCIPVVVVACNATTDGVPAVLQTAVGVCNWLQQLHCHAAGLLRHCCPVHTSATLTIQQQDRPGLETDHQSSSIHQQQQQQQELSTGCAQQGCLSSEACCRIHGSNSSGELPSIPTTQHEWEAAWAPLNPALLPTWRSEQQQTLCCENKTAQQQQQQTPQHDQAEQAQRAQQGCGQQEQQPPRHLPCSWSEYYQLKGLPEQSPVGEMGPGLMQQPTGLQRL
jgi:hypothetical protein